MSCGEALRQFGLADTHLPFEQQRTAESQRDQRCGGEAAVGEVANAAQSVLQVRDARRRLVGRVGHDGQSFDAPSTRSRDRGAESPSAACLPAQQMRSRRCRGRHRLSAMPSKREFSGVAADFGRAAVRVGADVLIAGPDVPQHRAVSRRSDCWSSCGSLRPTGWRYGACPSDCSAGARRAIHGARDQCPHSLRTLSISQTTDTATSSGVRAPIGSRRAHGRDSCR